MVSETNDSVLQDHDYSMCEASFQVTNHVATQTIKPTCVKCTQVEKPKTFSQGVMTTVPMKTVCKDAEIQTSLRQMNDCAIQCEILVPSVEYPDDDEMEDEDAECDDDDEEWFPTEEDLDSDGDENHDDDFENNIDITDGNENHNSERKYIVFESCLRSLLSVCLICLSCCQVAIKRFHGCMVVFETVCVNGHIRTWSSQPLINKMPVGNLLVSGGILFSGSSATKILNCLQHSGILTFSERTYRRIQAAYLIPAVETISKRYQTRALQTCEGRDVKLGGDARCCSPGHTAKYGSYSLMDLETTLLLDVQLLQVTEVKNSYSMEIEGLKRGLAALKERNIRVTDLTTDRHVQIKKHMRENETCIRHWFDVWHMAKGISKKILAAAKTKGSEVLEKWAHSISNHLYWSAATSNGDGDLVLEKWKSISNHVCNVHEGHGELYPRCQHEPIDRRLKWIKQGSKVHKELNLIVLSKYHLKDIRQLSPAEQTSQLKSYHKLVCQFAPKFQHFFYNSMKARILLAAIHNNDNVSRRQATTKDGKKRWKISYPKYKKGNHVVKAVKEECSYNYVDELMEELVHLRDFPTYESSLEFHERDIPSLTTEFAPRVDKDQAVLSHRSRFNRQ